MKLSRIAVLGVAICAMVMMVSCTHNYGTKSPIPTMGSVMPLVELPTKSSYTVLGMVEGSACGECILSIFGLCPETMISLGGQQQQVVPASASLITAVKQALASKNADAIANPIVEVEIEKIGPFFQTTCVRIMGTGIKYEK